LTKTSILATLLANREYIVARDESIEVMKNSESGMVEARRLKPCGVPSSTPVTESESRLKTKVLRGKAFILFHADYE
jgi:hypothetical protein